MNTIKRIATLAGIALLATACATTPAGQQTEKERADQLFGKAKVALVVASITVSGYNVLCASTLKASQLCAANVREAVNKAQAAAMDAVAGAERVFAAGNSTTDRQLQIAQIAVAAVNEFVNAVTKYVPNGTVPNAPVPAPAPVS